MMIGNNKGRVKIGKYKTVFQGMLFSVERAQAVLPSGEKTIFERAVRRGSVAVVPIDGKGRIWLCREWRDNLGGYTWRLPSGRMEAKETPRAGAMRELREEAGVRASRLKLFYRNNGGVAIKWKTHIFLAAGLVGAPLPKDSGEDITVRPMTFARAYKLVQSGQVDSPVFAYVLCRAVWQRNQILRWAKTP